MGKIDELIQQYCPDGVEYKRIDSYTKVLRGKRLTKDLLSDDNKYPVYHGGLDPLGFYNSSNRKAGTVMVINVGASAGTVGYSDVEFWSSDGCFCIDKNESVNDKFLYYYLKNNEHYFVTKVRKAGIPTLDNFIVESFEIPVPPLPVQEEIVRILDKMTELETELETELDLRKKQYEYYRDKMLSDEYLEQHCPDGVEYKRFDEACTLHARIGWQRLTKSEHRTSGDYMLITGTDFTTSNEINYESCVYVNEERYEQDKKLQLKNGDILVTKDGTLGKIAQVNGLPKPATLNGGVFVVRPVDDKLCSRFILHYLLSDHFMRVVHSRKTGSTISHLTQGLFSQIKIPIPPLPVQEEIVRILDKFSTLTSDISEGLPAEIKMRHQQYEYYRDKFLTFKRLEDNAV